MILHDSFFVSLNDTNQQPIVMSFSQLFGSTWTLIISLIGCLTNLFSLLKFIWIFIQHRRRSTSIFFLWMLILNHFCLAFLSLISSIDEQFYYQSLIAHFHLCSLTSFLWKFTLHFSPLVTIFLLMRSDFQYRRFYSWTFFDNKTSEQIFSTHLYLIIPFVLAVAWSVDGLWIWGVTSMRHFLPSSADASILTTPETMRQQPSICYIQINDNLQFTARLLYLIKMDYVLLLVLHCLGLFVEIFLHLRLSCGLIANRITMDDRRQQRITFFILYFLMCLTLTSLPFYFYRLIESFFDSKSAWFHHDLMNSSTFAQLLLVGVSVQPFLYVILFLPSGNLFGTSSLVRDSTDESREQQVRFRSATFTNV